MKFLNTTAQYTCFILICTCIFAPLPESHALPSNKILSAAYDIHPDKETIEIRIKEKPQVTSFSLDHPKRIVFVIQDSFFPRVHQTLDVHGTKINRLRISQNTKTQTRLVMDVSTDTDFQTETQILENGQYLLKIHVPIRHEPAAAGLHTPDFEDNPSPSAPIENQTIVQLNSTSVDESIFDAVNEPDKAQDSLALSGSIQVRTALDIDQHKGSARKNQNSLKNKIMVKASYQKALTLSGVSDYLYFGDQDQSDDYVMDLHEMYFRHQIQSLNLSVGKQIIRWGKADQISPIDTLNPENMTELFIPSYEERKIPVWMMDITFHRPDFFIEGVVIPFFEPSKFDYFGTDWAIFSHLKNDISNSLLPLPVKSYVNALRVHETTPSAELDNVEYAFRIGGTIQQLDFGFTYHYAFEDLPYFESFPVKKLSITNTGSIQDLVSDPGSLSLTDENIETRYLRTSIFGFEFETIVSDFGIRGELAYKDEESFLTGSLTSSRTPTLFWVLGADYTSLNHWYLNLQFAHQHIADYDSSTLFFDRDNYSLIGEVSRDLMADWLNAAVQYTVILNDSSYYLSPRLVYTHIKNLEVIMGLNLFEGSDDSILGRYDDNDQVFIDLTYQF